MTSVASSLCALEFGERLAALRYARVFDEGLDDREKDRCEFAEQDFVMFELVELAGERLSLLYLDVHHLEVLRGFLCRVDDRLDRVGWGVNDPMRSCRHGDAERHESLAP